MNIKALVSPIALVAGLAVSSAAFAQTTVGDQQIDDADLGVVQAHCDGLASAAMTPDTLTENTTEDSGSDEGSPDTNESDTTGFGEAPLTPGLDLDRLTLQDCEDAGLV